MSVFYFFKKRIQVETYISILRGINVSGHKKIEMAGLKALYEELHFKDVTTYIQSGNVIFKTAKKVSNSSLSKTIEQAVFQKYNFQVPVITRTLQEMEQIISVNPFLTESDIDTEKLHVTFLSETPDTIKLENINNFNYPPDRFVITGKEVFLYCPVNYGETKLSNNFFESKLKVTATTRNWKTVNKLVELAKAK